MSRVDIPRTFRVSSRRFPVGAARAALDAGETVILLSSRDEHLRRALETLARPVQHAATVRLGDGRSATTLSDSPTPAPYAWRMKEKPAPVWRWSCRRCSAVDQRWSWPLDEADEASPMVRYAVNTGSGVEPLVEVPWRCPRSACHGAPRWILCQPA